MLLWVIYVGGMQMAASALGWDKAGLICWVWEWEANGDLLPVLTMCRLVRVIWAIYSPRYKNKEMTNKYAEGAHCFPLARLPKLFTDLSSAGPKPVLKPVCHSAHTRLHKSPFRPQHLVFLSFKLREKATIEIEHSRHSVPCSHDHLFPSFVQTLLIPHSQCIAVGPLQCAELQRVINAAVYWWPFSFRNGPALPHV